MAQLSGPTKFSMVHHPDFTLYCYTSRELRKKENTQLPNDFSTILRVGRVGRVGQARQGAV